MSSDSYFSDHEYDESDELNESTVLQTNSFLIREGDSVISYLMSGAFKSPPYIPSVDAWKSTRLDENVADPNCSSYLSVQGMGYLIYPHDFLSNKFKHSKLYRFIIDPNVYPTDKKKTIIRYLMFKNWNEDDMMLACMYDL